ncbi:MAG TPA: hypothetical protein DEQ34_12205 [Balneolaceae bacterium]|nr:hypothetical protein [Balneolaceae bacterium]|tara:strand:+ start:37222 stop:37743 length:522 start_codon:yes stop_codon:yes gene_type:complete
MKSFKNIFAVLAVVAIASTAAFAQTSASDNVGAAANVLASLNITVVDTVSFGAIATGTSGNVTVGADGVDAGAGTGSQRGRITITGTGNSAIDITYDVSATLTDGTTPLPTMDVEIFDGTTVDSDGAHATALSGGTLDVYVGGTINFAGTETAGNYSTSNTGGDDIAITVDYQ